MHYNSFLKSILFLVSIVLFASCDKDYSTVGDALIGENHFDLSKYTSSVVAYNEKITPIQSDNLPVNALGIYDNPAFGKTTANFATQIILASTAPTIGANPVIDDVYLEVPYFSTLLSTDASGNHVYELDSIYGEPKAKIKLSVYESGYFMRDLDPVGGFQTAQKYFTDQNTDFDNLKVGSRLNDDASVDQNDAFFFDPAEHKVDVTDATTGKVTTTRTVPSMRLKLNSAFFDSKIIHAPSSSLATNDVFKNYFRGLYFKVEQSGTDAGSLSMINFAKGTITVKYKEDLVTVTKDANGNEIKTTTRVDKSIILNMTGNTVSMPVQSNTNADYNTAISTSNPILGDEKLYLKGGEGSMAVIKLFGPDLYGADGTTGSPNGVADELDIIRKSGWLINEANLVFNIDADNTEFKKSYEPQRIYLFDLNNRRPIIDYYMDGTSGTTTKNGKVIFGGNINLDATSKKRGTNYKIRITNQIRNLVKYSDSTNVRMGVVVTESVAIADSNVWRTPATPPIPQVPYYTLAQPKLLKYRNIETPKASVMNPLGTILFGSKSTVPADKRLKLEIYYTKPN
jgi:hypothetical protein